MQHTISVSNWSKKIGPQVEEMAAAIEACVHCGFCLPTCPTYQVLGEEMDSPRGRILLMKSVLEEDLSFQDVFPYVDKCLGCLACVTSCPSGVEYGELVMSFRAYASKEVSQPVMDRMRHKLVRDTLPYSERFRTAASIGLSAKSISGILPEQLRSMLELLPDKLPEPQPLPEKVQAEGKRRAKVALLLGCVQQVLKQRINWATVRVLSRNGVEVLIPQEQGCCGALSIHMGEIDQARFLARQNFHIFTQDVDAILTNAAGCGSVMKEYPYLFKGSEDEEQAVAFSLKVQDVSDFLNQLGLVEIPESSQPIKIAYHDACHLAHAQKITDAPRSLLNKIENLTLLEIPDGEICCGSAGTYNLEHPEIARELGLRKTKNILESGVEAIVAGNIGCQVQIEKYLSTNGNSLPVYHTFELLDILYSEPS